MLNFNGELTENGPFLYENRGFLYGDAVFETVKCVNGKLLFWEDHYFRLMAGLRIVRMQIPMEFTMEFLEAQISKLTTSLASESGAFRVRLSVFRNGNGLYAPQTNTVSYLITAKPLPTSPYVFKSDSYEVDLYKDFLVPKQLLSNLKTNNRILNVTGSIFAQENDLQNCLLLNTEKNVIEALNGNLFMVTGHHVVTPPLSEGCLNGIMRKQLISLLKANNEIVVEESIISPFELQKADELFICNVITGIQPITRYRKKEYDTVLSRQLVTDLNRVLSLE